MKRFHFLLDTNAASEPGKPRPDLGLVEWLQEHQHEAAIPIVTLYELRKGIEALPFDSPHRRQRERHWRTFLLAFAEAVLPFDFLDAWAAAEHFHRLRADLGERCLDAVGWSDFLIAAQARAHGLIVVTRNTRHFPHCETLNPWLKHPPA